MSVLFLKRFLDRSARNEHLYGSDRKTVKAPKLEHIRSILLSPSDIPCHVNVPASHRSTWRQVYRYVTAITHKPVRNRVVDHDARCIQFNTIPVAKKADGRLGVEQFRILILNNMTNTRSRHCKKPCWTSGSLRIVLTITLDSLLSCVNLVPIRIIGINSEVSIVYLISNGPPN